MTGFFFRTARMSVGKHTLPDAALSRRHIDQSIAALLKKVTVARDFWVPYLAGYSTDWVENPTVFIDHRLPKTLTEGNKLYDITRYLLIHESVEKCLMHDLGFHYVLAHNLATGSEKAAVEADGLSWALYTKVLQPYIRQAVHRPSGLAAPPRLDIAPYVQEKAPFLDKLKEAM